MMRGHRNNRIVIAAIAALVAGMVTYAYPATGIEHHAARTLHAFKAACPFDWDQAPVARAMFSITQ